jgi:hypothetical protein
MLTKLLKHEFRATARLFLPFYLILLLFALVNRFLSFEMISRLVQMAPPFGIAKVLDSLVLLLKLVYFALLAGVLIATLLVMIQRFSKNLLGDEGYLMFTLPVSPWQHLASKLITAAVWTMASGLVTIGSILLLSVRTNPWPLVLAGFNGFRETFGLTGLFVFPGAALVTMISGILMIYAAIALGHLSSRYRILVSLAWYAALSIATKVLLLLVLLPYAEVYWGDIVDAATDAMKINLMAFWYWLLPAVVLGTLYFFLTNYILNRRLNLE